jgi:hypothetical protein
MTIVDDVMTRFGQALELSQRGERRLARERLTSLWEEIGPTGDALHRVSVAHALADVQDDLGEELGWDLRALEAADEVTDERATQAGVAVPVAGLYPSLHLNLGEDYRRLGDLASARHHLTLGRRATRALGDDGYSRMIKGALDALAVRLGTS